MSTYVLANHQTWEQRISHRQEGLHMRLTDVKKLADYTGNSRQIPAFINWQEMEGNQSSVRAAPCGKWKAKALRSRTPAEDRRPRRQGECRGEAASSPCLAGPHPNPDFFSALFPSVQKYSEKNSQKGPSWLIHSQNSEVQGSLSRHPARAHSKAPCSAEQHRSRIWSRTSHRTLCYLIPLTPFSNQRPILFTAQDQPK